MRTVTYFAAAIIAVLGLAACIRQAQAGTGSPGLKSEQKRSSVSVTGGVYKIDTTVIWRNEYKASLLTELKTATLAEKKTVEDIPAFIREFLNGLSPGEKFDMANPGKEWRMGCITDFGKKTCLGTLGAENNSAAAALFSTGKCLPDKQLIYFGMGKEIALFSFNSGGFNLHQVIAIIKFNDTTCGDKRITDFWFMNASTTVASRTGIISYIGRKEHGC